MLDRVGGEVATASAGSGSHGAESGAPLTDFLSWSRYTTVTNCLRSFKLKYIDQVPQRPQGAQLGGKTVHSIIEYFEHGSVIAPGHQAFADEWSAVVAENPNARWSGRATKEYPNGEDADWWFKQGPRMLDNYFWLREQDEAIGRRLMQGPNGPVIEARVLMELGGASRVSGALESDAGDAGTAISPGSVTKGLGAQNTTERVAAPSIIRKLCYSCATGNIDPACTECETVVGGDGHGVQGEPGTKPPPTKAALVYETPAPPILWQGYLDALHVDDEGPLVTDYKAGRQVQAYSVFQLADYALAWTRTTGEIVTRGRVVNLRQRKAPEILDLTKAIETTEARYRDLAQTIELHREMDLWPAAPSSFCVSCSVKSACDIGSVLYPEE